MDYFILFFKSQATDAVKAQFPAAQNRPGASGRKYKEAAQTHTLTTPLSRPLISGINLPFTYIC